MIRNLHAIAIALSLSMSGFAANAAETTAGHKSANCSIPDFPTAWVDDGLRGTVQLAVLVGADGSVKDAKVVSSSGYRELDKASLRAGATCKFGATSKDSSGTRGWTTVQYEWIAD